MPAQKHIPIWIPMAGLWDPSSAHPIYLKPQEINQPYGQPFGICISGVRFQGGTAKVTVNFPKTVDGGIDPNASGGILLGFRSLNDEYVYAAVGGYGFGYAMGRFKDGRWVGFAVSGSREHLIPEHRYCLTLRVLGQRLVLEDGEVPVLTGKLENVPIQGQLGLFAWGENKVGFTEPRVADEPGKVFVIMPFSDYYLKELYADVIKPTVEEENNNLIAHHEGETLGPGLIIRDIERHITESKVVIAEITECNRNVFYEVGYAHASNVPTILLVQKGIELPFDVGGYRCIVYENTISGRGKIIERLRNEIKEIIGT